MTVMARLPVPVTYFHILCDCLFEWFYVDCIKPMCRTASKRQTDSRTNGQTPGIEFGALNHKMWHLVVINLMIDLIINWPNFVYLLVDPGFLPLPLKFILSITIRCLIGWTPLTDTTDERTKRQTDVSPCPLVRLSLKYFWVRHYGDKSSQPCDGGHCRSSTQFVVIANIGTNIL